MGYLRRWKLLHKLVYIPEIRSASRDDERGSPHKTGPGLPYALTPGVSGTAVCSHAQLLEIGSG